MLQPMSWSELKAVLDLWNEDLPWAEWITKIFTLKKAYDENPDQVDQDPFLTFMGWFDDAMDARRLDWQEIKDDLCANKHAKSEFYGHLSICYDSILDSEEWDDLEEEWQKDRAALEKAYEEQRKALEEAFWTTGRWALPE